MKLSYYFLFLCVVVCGVTDAMYYRTKNWVPMPSGTGSDKVIIWKGNDTKELVIIHYKPSTGAASGKRIRHKNPREEIPLTTQQLENYLIELKEETAKA